MTPQDPQLSELPEPDTDSHSRWHISLIWVVPIVAGIAGAVLAVRTYLEEGPQITIQFETAEGLTPGETEVKYKNVTIGKVTEVNLTDDRTHVLASVDLKRKAENFAVDGTRFWVVRPRADLGGVSGLTTILSGAYIGVDIGKGKKSERHFVGLEKPPAVTHDQKGRGFTLHAGSLGSLTIGAPIYYRRLPVGRVVGYELDDDGQGITLQAFVEAPYDKFVNANTRFWNVSGIDVNVGAEGVKINTESLVTILAGGLAFQTGPDAPANPEPAEDGHQFALFDTQDAAMAPTDGEAVDIVMHFFQSLRGLSVGAPLDFRGIEIGKVTGVQLDYVPDRKDFAGVVRARIYPERLGEAWTRLHTRLVKEGDETADETISKMVQHGLKAQLRTANLITGQLFVALDNLPGDASVTFPHRPGEIEVPTKPGSLDQIQNQIASIVNKLEAIPFDTIGKDLKNTLESTDKLLEQLNGELAPQLTDTVKDVRATLDDVRKTLTDEDAPVQLDIHDTMGEVDRAARSMRNLADYLQRHPEALIRGRIPDDAEKEKKP